jgi:uncharacterized protein (TIGR03086 family)
LADVVLDGFTRALDGFEAVLAGVAPGRWSAPSPCAGWSAADVAGHVIGDLRETEALARGRYTGIRADDPGSAGDDPLAAWRVARAGMMAALDPAALAMLVPGPWGQMPLGEILDRYAMEFLVHTWDLAQATGQVAVLDPGLVRDALEPARQFAQLLRLSGLVGPECAVAEDADDFTRLLAIFGRNTAVEDLLETYWPSCCIFTAGRPLDHCRPCGDGGTTDLRTRTRLGEICALTRLNW